MNEKTKRVSFDSNVKILHMRTWTFAFQQARKGEWARFAADRYRFELRKKHLESLLAKTKFFSNAAKYRFEMRKKRMESMLAKINFFSRYKMQKPILFTRSSLFIE